MTTTPIPIAMCGVGQWGPNLLRNLRQNPACRVVAIADRNQSRLEALRELYPDAAMLTDVADVATRSDVRAVVLATPAGLHEAHAAMLMDTGKDVLVEKPLAMTLEGGRRLMRQARHRRRVLMAGHTFLFNGAVQRARREIAEGSLGHLQLIQAQRMSLGQVRSDCNALWNLAPHDVSILLHWLGAMPVSVSARGVAFHGGGTQEDIAFCILEFPGNVLVSIQVSWMNPVKVRQMTLVGTRGMLVYDDTDADAPLRLFDQAVERVPTDLAGRLDRFRLQVRRGPNRVLDVDATEPLAAEIAHFLECVATRRQPLGSGEEALRVLSVLEALDRSIKNGGAPTTPESIDDREESFP